MTWTPLPASADLIQFDPVDGKIYIAAEDAEATPGLRPAEPMAPHTTYRIGGPAEHYLEAPSAARLTEAMLVANLALRTGRKILWDAKNMEARGCTEAAPYIKREYRTGW